MAEQHQGNHNINYTGLYPGCSLESTARGFLKSLEKVFHTLNIRYREIKDWNCCGSTSAHAVDPKLFMSLNLRNLALAEEQELRQLLVPCAACYHRLATVNYKLQNNSQLLESLNRETGLNYRGGVTIRNLLDFYVNSIGIEKISKSVTVPLTGLKAVCYYGCLNTRVPRQAAFDSVEYPTSMDRLVETLGAETLDWSYKTDCCGAGHFITNEKLSFELTHKILRDAQDRGAACIAVSCPMCHNNLDTKQAVIRKQYNLPKLIPIVFVSQLIGLAFGFRARSLGIQRSFVKFKPGVA